MSMGNKMHKKNLMNNAMNVMLVMSSSDNASPPSFGNLKLRIQNIEAQYIALLL